MLEAEDAARKQQEAERQRQHEQECVLVNCNIYDAHMSPGKSHSWCLKNKYIKHKT